MVVIAAALAASPAFAQGGEQAVRVLYLPAVSVDTLERWGWARYGEIAWG